MLRRPVKKLTALLDEKLLLIGPRSLDLQATPSAVPSQTVDFAAIVNLAIGRSESFLWSSHAAVEPVACLINGADLVRRWVAVSHEDVVALLCHLVARLRDQE